MKKISILKIAFLASFFLVAFTAQAAYTVAVYETADPTNIQHFEFASAGTNVSNQLIANVEAPAPLDECSFWVGQDQAQVSGISVEQTVASLMSGVTCSGTSFSFTIYAGGTDANYKPENFKCIDTAEYTYGMACWPEQLTNNCSGGATSASSHVFAKTGDVWTYTFPVNDPSSTFKLLKSADGTTWNWDAGQLGHSQSGTQLTAGAGITIESNGQGNIALQLPGVETGDEVILTLQKTGAVYTLSAEFLAKPILQDKSDLCVADPMVACQITNYDPVNYAYAYTINGGAPISLASSMVEIASAVRGTQYTLVVTATQNGYTVMSDQLVVEVPQQVPQPIVQANATECDNEVGFTITNYANYASGVTFQLPAGYVQDGAEISLVNAPADGTVYALAVTVTDGCTSAVSSEVSQTYKASPAQPVLQTTSICDQITFAVTNSTASSTYEWKVDNVPVVHTNNQYAITGSVDGMLHTAEVKVVAANGCEATTTASAIYKATPVTPTLSSTVTCDDITFEITPYDASKYQYAWSINGVGLVNAQATHSITNAVHGTTFQADVAVSAANGCSTSTTASATYKASPAAPLVQVTADCNLITFQIDAYEPTQYTYAWTVDNQSVTPTGAQHAIATSTHGTMHRASVTATREGCTSPAGEASATFVTTPAKPVLQVDGGCDKEVVFTLTNYDATAQYKWTISTSAGTSNDVVPQNGTNEYKVVAPVDGVTYFMDVVASHALPGGNVCSVAADRVQQQCQLSPQAPSVDSYHACQQVGTKSWADLVRVAAGNSLVWYDMSDNLLLVPPVDFDTNEPGVKSYKVAQKSALGCIGPTSEVMVTIEEIPQAFAGNDIEICSGVQGVILAEGVTPNPNATYSWMPASYLESSNVASPTLKQIHVTQDDEIEFTLTVANANMASCKSTDQVKVKVMALPQVVFQETTTGRIDVCEGSSTGVNIVAEPGITYEWIDPNNVLVNKMSTSAITKTLTTNESIAVMAVRRTTTTVCESAEQPLQFNVVALPVFSASGGKGDQLSVCEGKTIQLGEAGNNQTNYQWETQPAGRLDTTTPNPRITVTEDVTYTVTATLKQAPYCSSTSSVYVQKAALPSVYTLTAEGSTIYCEGGTGVTLMLGSSDTYVEYALYRGAVEYQTWQPGTGGILRWNNVTAGLYTVKARVISSNPDEQCTADMNGTVEVTEKPAPSVSLSNLGMVACPGDETTVVLDFTGDPDFYANLLINGRSENIHATTNQYTFTYTPKEYAAIQVTELRDQNCTRQYDPVDYPTLEFDIINMADYKIQSSDNRLKICQEDPVTLSINYDPVVDTDVHVVWSTTDENVASITVSPSVTTMYYVEVYTEGAQCMFKDSITISVASVEDIVITGLGDSLFCSTDNAVAIQATPAGGVFTSDYQDFVVGNFLYPNAVKGANADILLKYSVNNEGCVLTDSVMLAVNYVPDDIINWGVLPMAVIPDMSESYRYCQPHPESPKQNLTLQGYPVDQTGYFTIVRSEETPQEDTTLPDTRVVPVDRNLAKWDLVDLSPGTFRITYTITDVLGCSASKTKTLTIDPDEQQLIDNEGIYLRNSQGVQTNKVCILDTEATLYADIQASGKYALSKPAMLVTQDQTKSIATINPSKAGGVGTQRAVLTMEDEKGCPHTYSLEFEVKSPVNIHSFGLTKENYCSYDADEPIVITSATETDGTVSIYRILDDGTEELVDAVVPKDNPPYFSPQSWGAGKYRIEYNYSDIDGVCTALTSVEVNVFDPPTINLNLLEDYCRGEKVDLRAEPLGGSYTTTAPDGSLIFTTFDTQKAGIGLHTIKYTVSNEHKCVSSAEMEVQVHGTDNLQIFGLREKYCSPTGIVTINGFPTENGEGYFTGPTFLTNRTDREGYADLDLTQGDFDTSYDVTYHYKETYFDQFGAEQTCESTLKNKFTILSQAVDFGGIDDNMTLCGYETVWPIAANKTENVRFEISPASVSHALQDNGDGTAELYPNLLPEDAVYAITAYYTYYENGVEVCSSQRTKSFTIANIAQVSDVTLFCDDGENAVRLKDTDTKVEYELTVNGVPFGGRLAGTGGDLDFPAISISSAHVQVAGYEAGCKVMMSKELEIKRLEAKLEEMDITCNGENDGKVSAIVSGGSLPYQHQFVHTESGEVFSDSYLQNRPIGTYQYTVTDAIGCQRTATAQITEPTALDANIYFDNPKCNGGLTGSARVEPISGTGTAPYTYAWYNMLDINTVIATTAEVDGLESGQYRCVITDKNGCFIYRGATINAPASLQLSLVEKQDIAITGSATGFIEVTTTGGNPPYTYTWNGNSFTTPLVTTDARQENLVAGNYYVLVTDARGCMEQIAVTLTEPTEIVLSAQLTHVSCNGGNNGAIRMQITGGDQPYQSVVWTLPDGTTATSQSLTNLIAGDYTLEVIDAKGNTVKDMYRITEPLPLEIAESATSRLKVDCFGDQTAKFDIEVAGGTAPYAFEWPGLDPATQVFEEGKSAQNLGKGLYTVNVKDANGCSISLTREVTQPDATLSWVKADVVQNQCAGDAKGSIDVEVTGGTAPYTYAWMGAGVLNPTNQVQTDLISGHYKVVVTDATGICSIEREFTIEELDEIVIEVKGTNVTCANANNATIEAHVTGGKPAYHYEWTHVETGAHYQSDRHHSLPAGTYNLAVSDALQCERYASITVTEPTALQIAVSSTNVTCNGANDGTAVVTVTGGTGGYSYSWEDAATAQEIATVSTLTNLAPGSYRVKVTDENGCFVWSEVFTITQPEALTLTYIKDDVAIKGQATGAISVTPAGGTTPYVYNWLAGPSINDANRNQPILTDLLAGNYLVEVTDDNGCSVTTPITITQNEDIAVTVKVTPITCHGQLTGSLEITQVKGGDGQYTYQWTSPSGFASTDKNIASLGPDEYTLLLTDGAGATFTGNYIIEEPAAITVSTIDIFSKLAVSCYGDTDGAIRIAVEGGVAPYQITWDGPGMAVQPADATHATQLAVGTYQVKVVDALGCEDRSYNQTITGPAQALVIDQTITQNNCYGETQGQIDLNVTGGTAPYAYAWSGGSGLVPDAEDQTTLHNGETYRVEVKDANGCTQSAVYTLEDRTELLFAITKEDVKCHGGNTGKVTATQPVGGTAPYVYKWKNQDGSIDVTQLELADLVAGTYTFSVTDQNGCFKQESVTVNQPNALDVNIEATDVLCSGKADGVAYANIPDGSGVPNYEYVWFKNDQEYARGTAQLANLGEGNYRVEVTDANGCRDFDLTTINSSTPMNIVINVTNIDIHGASTGAIDVAVTGGTAPLTYAWSGVGIDPNKAGNEDQTDLTAGRYNLIVEDGLTCRIDTTIDVTQPESMQVISTVKNIKCYGEKGLIELRVQGGNLPYSAEWTGPDGFTSTDLNIYDLEPGSYEVNVYDAGKKNKVGPLRYQIVEKTPVEVALLQSSKTQLNCNGDADGSISIQVMGGTEPYTVKWSGPNLDVQNVYNVANLGVGVYKAEVTDRNGCVPAADFEQEITQPTALIFEAAVTQNACHGVASGNIDITVGEGTAPYTYSWTGIGVVPDAEDQTNLVAGRYHLVMKDANLCVIDTTFVLQDPVKNTATLSGNGVICEGSDVTLHFNLTGTAPWTVEYTDGRTVYTETATERFFEIQHQPTQSCTFRLIKVVDALGCEAALSGEVPVEVHVIPELTILGADTDCCLGEPAYIDVLFGNGNGWTLTYTVDDQTIQDGTYTNSHDSLVITPRFEGTKTYTITRVSNQYCHKEVNETFDITAYRYPSLSVVVDSHICEPAPLNVSLHATGGAPWDVVYYMNDLRYEHTMTTEEDVITFTAYQDENHFLFESITSGERCKTILGKEVINTVGLLPRDAKTIVGNAKVCRGSSEVYSTPEIDYAEDYIWQLPEGYTIASGLGSNQITVDIAPDAVGGEITVYGKNRCGEGTKASLLIEVDSPIAEGGVITMMANYVCKNSKLLSMTIAEPIEGAEYYEWSVPTGFSIVSGQGTRGVVLELNEYAQSSTISVTPMNHCASAQPIEQYVLIRPLPLAEAGVDFTTLNCATDAQLSAAAIDVTTNANSWQKWSLVSGAGQIEDENSPITQVEDLLFGENKFRWDVYDGYCANYDTIKVTNNNPGITQPEATDITVCEDFITLRAPAPEFGQGRWTLVSGDGEVLTPEANETDVIDLSTRTTNVVMWEVYYGNCSNSIPVNITSHSLQDLADAGEDGVTTNGTYRLSAQTFNNASVTGTWTVVSGSGVFEDPNSPITNVTGLAPGYNTLRWTLKGYNCEAYDDIRVRSADEPIAGFNMVEDTGCEPFNVQFDNITIGKADFVWDFGDGAASTLRSPSHLYEEAGVYKVTLTAIGKHKTDKAEKTVTVLPSPEASFTVSSAQLYVPNAEAHFFNETDKAVSYYWDFGDGHSSTDKDPVHTYYEDGEYDITYIVTDENGCQDTLKYEKYIHVGKGSFIVFPTAFTPNVSEQLDGIYSPEERRLDIFYPIWRNVDTYKLEIFNQWGNKVFSTDDVLQGWNGYYLDQPAAQGVYVFKAEGRFRDGTAFREGGSVLLIR